MDQPGQGRALGELKALKAVIEDWMGFTATVRQAEFHGEGMEECHQPKPGGNGAAVRQRRTQLLVVR
jgi:hypothetical protein